MSLFSTFAPSSVFHLFFCLQQATLLLWLRPSQTKLCSTSFNPLNFSLCFHHPWLPLISFHFFHSPCPETHSLSSPDPFQVQAAKGCELHFGEPSVGFMWIAYQGSDLVIFQNKSWWPSPKGRRRAQQVCRLFNQYHVINVRLQAHISDTCPHFLLGLLDAGKTHLQRQGQSCSFPPRFLYSALINLHHSLKFMVRRSEEGLTVTDF